MHEDILTPEEMQFLKEHKADLLQNNVDHLYEDINTAFFKQRRHIIASHFTELFLSNGVNPLDYFKGSLIYPKFAVHIEDLKGEIVIPDSIKFIGANAFVLCTNITKIKCKSVTTIGIGAFMDCYNLKEIDLGDALDTLEGDAFASTAIETLVLPKTLRTITTGAFNDMPNLTKLVFEGIPEYIGKNAVIQKDPHKMIIEVPWTREFEQEKIKNKEWSRNWVVGRRNCKVVYKG